MRYGCLHCVARFQRWMWAAAPAQAPARATPRPRRRARAAAAPARRRPRAAARAPRRRPGLAAAVAARSAPAAASPPTARGGPAPSTPTSSKAGGGGRAASQREDVAACALRAWAARWLSLRTPDARAARSLVARRLARGLVPARTSRPPVVHEQADSHSSWLLVAASLVRGCVRGASCLVAWADASRCLARRRPAPRGAERRAPWLRTTCWVRRGCRPRSGRLFSTMCWAARSCLVLSWLVAGLQPRSAPPRTARQARCCASLACLLPGRGCQPACAWSLRASRARAAGSRSQPCFVCSAVARGQARNQPAGWPAGRASVGVSSRRGGPHDL
jgi:hypothetical protein